MAETIALHRIRAAIKFVIRRFVTTVYANKVTN